MKSTLSGEDITVSNVNEMPCASVVGVDLDRAEVHACVLDGQSRHLGQQFGFPRQQRRVRQKGVDAHQIGAAQAELGQIGMS